MIKFTCMVLLSALVVADADRVDLNSVTDRSLKLVNEFLRNEGITWGTLESIEISPNVTFSKGTSIGLDSIHRTGDCWMDEEKTSASVHANLGLHLLTIFLPSLIIDGQDMSAFLRIRNNSVVFAYTINSDKKCQVTLDDIRLERLSDVEFASSRIEFDGLYLDDFFATVVVPQLNERLRSSWTGIEQLLQFMCPHDEINGDHLNLAKTLSAMLSSAFTRY